MTTPNPWTDLAKACHHPDPEVAAMRAEYALAAATQTVFDHTLRNIRRHIATYAVWNAGRIHPDRLADSLCDHLRDITPLPIDIAVEQEFP